MFIYGMKILISSVDGIRYAVTQHNAQQTNITDIYNRKTSNKEDIFNYIKY